MVVEVAGVRVMAEAHVDSQIRGCELLRIPGANHLERVAEQAERRDREDLVGVEGPVVGGDAHVLRS